jgi:succinate dehydrogenase/fumarate reductase flavoprotein subunit
MISGESYKAIVAEAAKNALNTLGDNGQLIERVFVTEPLFDGDRISGAVGFSVRENKFYVFKAKAIMSLMGGAVHVFRPRSVGEGLGRAWYPPWNSGSSTYFCAKAGAELTCQEVRFIPVRFKTVTVLSAPGSFSLSHALQTPSAASTCLKERTSSRTGNPMVWLNLFPRTSETTLECLT